MLNKVGDQMWAPPKIPPRIAPTLAEVRLCQSCRLPYLESRRFAGPTARSRSRPGGLGRCSFVLPRRLSRSDASTWAFSSGPAFLTMARSATFPGSAIVFNVCPIDNALVFEEEGVGVNLSQVWSDAILFRQLADDYNQTARIDLLSALVNLYKGPFLDGLMLAGCVEYNSWMRWLGGFGSEPTWPHFRRWSSNQSLSAIFRRPFRWPVAISPSTRRTIPFTAI